MLSTPPAPGSATPDDHPLYVDPLVRITALSDRRGLRLTGDVDRSNAARVADVLAPMTRDGGEVYVDLGRLDFIDLGGIETLTHASRQLAGRGRLVLTDPSPMVRRVLAMFGWDMLTSLAIVDTGMAR